MTTHNKSFLDLTAGDIMTGPVESIHQDMSLPAAAGLLRHAQVSGAPVVDGAGRCVGVLSVADLVRWAENLHEEIHPDRREICTCSFLEGERCTLPVGTCPIQGTERNEEGKEVPYCRMPRCVLTDWQVVIDAPAEKKVQDFMTADPVMVHPERPLTEVAQMMVDAHIHRVIVVDEESRPIGIVSGTDVIAAVARFAAGHPEGRVVKATCRTILYPTDLSEAAEAAFPVACTLARKDGARIVVLHVYPSPLGYGEFAARRQPDSCESDLRHLLSLYQSPEPEVRVEHRLVEGEVTSAILRVAEEEGCDLIVMGTRGRTGLARMLLGSVAERVLRQAPCPVLTVRPHSGGNGGKESRKEEPEMTLAHV